MPTRKDDGRKLIQLTMKPDLYAQVKATCAQLDIPCTVWMRELIKRELNNPTITP
jgi:hypothetical protein